MVFFLSLAAGEMTDEREQEVEGGDEVEHQETEIVTSPVIIFFFFTVSHVKTTPAEEENIQMV